MVREMMSSVSAIISPATSKGSRQRSQRASIGVGTARHGGNEFGDPPGCGRRARRCRRWRRQKSPSLVSSPLPRSGPRRCRWKWLLLIVRLVGQEHVLDVFGLVDQEEIQEQEAVVGEILTVGSGPIAES